MPDSTSMPAEAPGLKINRESVIIIASIVLGLLALLLYVLARILAHAQDLAPHNPYGPVKGLPMILIWIAPLLNFAGIILGILASKGPTLKNKIGTLGLILNLLVLLAVCCALPGFVFGNLAWGLDYPLR